MKSRRREENNFALPTDMPEKNQEALRPAGKVRPKGTDGSFEGHD
jgi:hypothetical protein